MGRKRTACKICSIIKAKCTGGQPCLRCRRLRLCCDYGEVSKDGQASLQSPDYAPSHSAGVWDSLLRKAGAGHTRSTAGCANCRRRRKKCDEQTPTCGDCQRLGIFCTRPLCAYRSCSQISRQDGQILASREEEYPIHDGVFQAEDTSLSNWIALIQSDRTLETSRPSSLAHSTALAYLGLPCASDDQVGLATFLPLTALNTMTGVTFYALQDWSIVERHLLNHFTQAVARALVVVPDNENPFLRIAVPMALESTMVRHALVTLSACHLSVVYPDFEHNVLFHRSQALQGLKAELAQSSISEASLATTLILSLAEVRDYIIFHRRKVSWLTNGFFAGV
jgi:transcriptional activator protein UGA3